LATEREKKASRAVAWASERFEKGGASFPTQATLVTQTKHLVLE
jgi:hypothetical protein